MFGPSGNGGYHGIQMLGLMNALKTGDATTDTLIAMSLPVILTKVVEHLSRRHGDTDHETWWSRLRFFSKRLYKRTISHTDRSPNLNAGGTGGGLDEDSYNMFLIKAINLYIHEHCHFNPDDLDLELTDALSSNMKQSGSLPAITPHNRLARRKLQGSKTQQMINNSSASTYGMLENCSIIQKPVHNKWHDIGSFDGKPVHIWISESLSTGGNASKQRHSDDGDEGASSHSIHLRLRSEGPTSVDSFVHKAYSWYMMELEKEQCDDRFFYDLKGFEGRGSHRYPVFGKYPLSDEKTFKSLFSRKCHDLLKLIDQFQNKSGKYSVPGYPHKLGLLLHGPPGTGKTSLIKAVAHETKRHIVNVPLSRIETNNELMTLFFNQRYVVSGQGPNGTPKMDFDQVIFCFEDIDAATEVVKRREEHSETPRSHSEIASLGGTGHSFSSQRRAELRNDKALDPRTNLSARGLTSPTAANSSGSNEARASFRTDEDRLNLMGMLNVLDGVVDTPGRMVIMTSNHPEVLDPALIRPGRIDKKLELGYMESPDVVAMLEHYYQATLSKSDNDRVHRSVNGSRDDYLPLELIPARVEQLAMEEETMDAMLAWLEAERQKLDATSNVKSGTKYALSSKPSNVTVDTEELSSVGTSSSEKSCQEGMD